MQTESSPPFTVGVEEESQIVHADVQTLQPKAREILLVIVSLDPHFAPAHIFKIRR